MLKGKVIFQVPKAPKGGTWYKFWIRSSRGTNDWEYLYLTPQDIEDNPLKYRVEEWADKFGAMHVSENMVHYGYKKVKFGKNGTSAQVEGIIRDMNVQKYLLERKVSRLESEVRRLSAVRDFIARNWGK